MYKKYITSLYNAIDWVIEAYKNRDINRNHTNYGRATIYGEQPKRRVRRTRG